MKKLFGLTVAALLIIGMVGGGTWAYFSDVETSTGNALSAGTLDLKIDNDDIAVTTFTATLLKPGDNNDSSHASSELKNNGTLPGTLKVATSVVTHAAGADPGDTDIIPTDSLYTTATMAIYIDVDASGTWTLNDIGLKFDETKYVNGGATPLDYATINSYATKTWLSVETMLASAVDKFCVNYRVPIGAGNEIQGGSASIDFTFTLDQ